MDAGSYINWIRQTLAGRFDGLDDGQRLAALLDLVAALRSSRTMIYGAVMPSEVIERARMVLLPELEREVDALRARGIEPCPRRQRPTLWRVYSAAEQRALLSRLLALPGNDEALGPYRRCARHAVGGLRAAGFAPGGDLLLVLSVNGRGVFDCQSGARVGRDHRDRRHAQYPTAVPGIPPVAGVDVPMMGLDGGRPMPRTTPRGWQLGVMRPEHQPIAWICPPGMSVDEPAEGAAVLTCGLEELRAAGFSDSGRSLVLAEPHTLHIFRAEPEAR